MGRASLTSSPGLSQSVNLDYLPRDEIQRLNITTRYYFNNLWYRRRTRTRILCASFNYCCMRFLFCKNWFKICLIESILHLRVYSSICVLNYHLQIIKNIAWVCSRTVQFRSVVQVVRTAPERIQSFPRNRAPYH